MSRSDLLNLLERRTMGSGLVGGAYDMYGADGGVRRRY